jgi:hypothetical protein
MSAPLTGLKVVKLARNLAEPWIDQTLANLDAEVIKVESTQGYDTRTWGLPFIDSEDNQSAAYFHCTNRGKGGIAIDFGILPIWQNLKTSLLTAIFWSRTSKLVGLINLGWIMKA